MSSSASRLVEAYLKTESVKAHPLVIVDKLVFSLMMQEVYKRLQVSLISHHYGQHLNASLYVYDLLPWLLSQASASVVKLQHGVQCRTYQACTCHYNTRIQNATAHTALPQPGSMSEHVSTAQADRQGKHKVLCYRTAVSISAHRQAILERKLVEALENIWIIVHFDGDLIQASFEGVHIMST